VISDLVDVNELAAICGKYLLKSVYSSFVLNNISHSLSSLYLSLRSASLEGNIIEQSAVGGYFVHFILFYFVFYFT
jgi:hypothetical protein